MAPLEFRFYYFTPLYERTVAFYRDVLSFEVYHSWDRSAAERGTIFRSPSGAGFIEVEAGDGPAALSGGLYIEVPDVRGRYEEAQRRGAPIVQELGEAPYGHLNFKTIDPSGLEVAFFQYLSRPPHAIPQPDAPGSPRD